MKIATGVFQPTGTSTPRSITFGVQFTSPPAITVFCTRAANTNTTAVIAKATSVSITGANIITSFVTPDSSGYTPAAEEYT
jgi:hypothetical protein